MSAMDSFECCLPSWQRRWTDYPKVAGSNPCTPSIMKGVLFFFQAFLYMISYMISYMIWKYHIWYHAWYHIWYGNIIYDIKVFLIWYMIWYHIWYLFFCSCRFCPGTARWCKRWWVAWAWCWLDQRQLKARCYTFNMKGHRFRGKNCQVHHKKWPYDMISYMISLLCNNIICDIIYNFLL